MDDILIFVVGCAVFSVTIGSAFVALEEAAIKHDTSIIKATDGEDDVTQDLCIRLLADEEEHLIFFRGFLKEHAAEPAVAMSA